MLWVFVMNLIAVTGFMACGWPISLIKKNVSIVDRMWGPGFVIIAWLTFFTSDGAWGRSLLICLLVTIWGLRLSLHITWRSWGKGEDPRYTTWRRKSGPRFRYISLFKVFLLQAFFIWLISLVIQYGQMPSRPDLWTVFDIAGLLLWMTGFMFEAVGDVQLARFKADPANQGLVMDQGLWRYSRHPNYFGEMLMWWGLFVMVLSTPYGFWTVISPLIITVILLKVTGVALTEKHILETRPAYREYIRKTSAFFPWFPRQ